MEKDSAPRKPSLTQRLIGNSREWLAGFYAGRESDATIYGQGFGDEIDDFVPGVLTNSMRRRTSSLSSSDSVESYDIPRRVRSASLTERIANMQVG